MNHLYFDETPPEHDSCPYCGGVLNAWHECMNHCGGWMADVYEKPELI